MSFSNLSESQIVKKVYDSSEEALKVKGVAGSLITEAFDYVELTNTNIGGQVVPTTVVYKTGGSGGTVVATLTLTYDGSANLETVTRT